MPIFAIPLLQLRAETVSHEWHSQIIPESFSLEREILLPQFGAWSKSFFPF